MVTAKKKLWKATVLGDGAWGTALAMVLTQNGHDVTLWAAFQENVEAILRDGENKRFLPGVKLPSSLHVTQDIQTAANSDLLVLASPSQYLRGTLKQFKPFWRKEQILVDISKGIEVDTLLRMSELTESVLGRARYVALSGPSHAEEVSRGIPTAVVVASRDLSDAKSVQNAFMNETFRVYTCHDMVGVELGGALKNVYAIAAGILDGIGLGDNTKAALMTRGIAEMARLGKALGGQRRTFSGLSGVGDLIVTCMSRHSRNRFVGEELGKGRPLDEIIQSMNRVVAEGVKTCVSARDLAVKAGVDTPIVNAVYDVLYHGRKPKDMVLELMTRKAKPEHD